MVINKDLTLAGSGAATTIVQAATGAGVANFRVFNIITGFNNVAISGLTIRYGNASGAGGDKGGGIHIGIATGSVALTNSIVSNNRAIDDGSGIYNDDGRLTVTNSTVSDNTALHDGGGIYSNGGTTLTLTNSTVSGNMASHGGGIYNSGIGSVQLVNSIIAGNTAPNRPDCLGLLTSLGYNLLGNSSDCNFTATTGDRVGTAASPVNPLLSPLADNGGPTFTHALLPGSPAIDAGDDSKAPATDQRGARRPQGRACDIGAFEVREGDVNGDGRIDLEDLRRVAAALGTSPPADPGTDVSGDRVVDALDLAPVARNFGLLQDQAVLATQQR